MIAVLSLAFLFATGHAQYPRDLADGAYLARTAGCTDCHTLRPDQPFAGGGRLVSPFGVFYTPNLTPDARTGIGSWNEVQFLNALRWGLSPSGSPYYPAFPYRSFTKITDKDVHKIFVYLRSLQPIVKSRLRSVLSFPYNQRWLVRVWDFFYFKGRSSDPEENVRTGQGPFEPVPGRSASWNRGAYLVEALLHCTECHTPRAYIGPLLIGNLESGQWLAGGNIPISGKYPPNITPDPETGTGSWSKADWDHFLRSGFDPNGKSPGGEMADVIRGTAGLTDYDRDAVIEYLRSIKPVRTPQEGEP